MRPFSTTRFFRTALCFGILSGAVTAFANPPVAIPGAVILLQNKLVAGRGPLIPVDGAKIKKILLAGPGADLPSASGSCPSLLRAFQERGRKDGFQVGLVPWNTSGFLPIALGALAPDEKTPDAAGLKGEYFPNQNLDGKPLGVRTDTAFPVTSDPLLKASGFSVRWTGFIKPPVPGKYRIRLVGEGKSRVWVADRLVYDGWDKDPRKGGMGEFTDVPEFKRGELCPLRIEYRGAGAPSISLSWMTFANKDFSAMANADLVLLVLAPLPAVPVPSDAAHAALPHRDPTPETPEAAREQEEFLAAAGLVNPATVAVFQAPLPSQLPASGAFAWAGAHLPAVFRASPDAAAAFVSEFFSSTAKKNVCKTAKF